MDRSDLIKALGSAFSDSHKKEEENSRIVISATAGEKDVLRLMTNYGSSSEKNLYQNHPDAHMVANLVEELSSSGQSNIAIVGRELIVKFNQAVENNDEEKISEIVATCRDCFFKLQSCSRQSPERALIYMTVIDKIKKM